MHSAKRRWNGVLLGTAVAITSAVVLAGLLSLLRPELVFAGFPLGAALGGAVASYQARRWPLMQGALAGLAAGLVELGFLVSSGPLWLPHWSVAGLVAITAVIGLLGARMAQTLHTVATQAQPGDATRDLHHEAHDTTPL
jgi:hypothetical protein